MSSGDYGDDDGDVSFSGPEIRPPQHASRDKDRGSRGHQRHGQQQRQNPRGGHQREERGHLSQRRDGRERGGARDHRGRDPGERSRSRHDEGAVDRRDRQQQRPGGDLRDRLGRRSQPEEHSRRDRDTKRQGGAPESDRRDAAASIDPQDAAARDQRLRRLMMMSTESSGDSRRDEMRRKRRDLERQAKEYEDKMRLRTTDSSRSKDTKDRRKRQKRSKSENEEETERQPRSKVIDSIDVDEAEDVKDDRAIDEEEEESGEDVSEEGGDDSGESETEGEGSESKEEGEEDEDSASDTASEQHGATPDHASEGEGHSGRSSVEEERRGKKRDKKRRKKEKQRRSESKSAELTPNSAESTPDHPDGKWRKHSHSEDDGRHLDEASRDHAHSESRSRTPSRSPTPRRGENHDEDEEDRQLEAALKGELKSAHDVVAEGTPNSQHSFGDDSQSQDIRRLQQQQQQMLQASSLPPYLPSIYGCRSVEEFHCLNRIEEGTYGVVYRARDKKTNDIVALKRLKMEKEKEGFPITSLREINTLLIAQHENVVTVREIVVGSNMDKIYIVMDFVEHDLKSLMETMREKKQVFLPGEVKCLMTQLLNAIAHLHDNWILHRDLKTSNLLLSHNGILKVGDFGLAREYGSPLKCYTQVVVTLWYRAPELLLGIKEYSTHIDVWSVGCIFGELLQMEPLLCGKSDQDQLNRIFKLLGTPTEKVWPGFQDLPVCQKVKFVEFPSGMQQLRAKFPHAMLSDLGMKLLRRFLTYDPKERISCEEALQAPYFDESPRAISPGMFPTWPAKSEVSAADKAKKVASPKPPSGGGAYKKINEDDIEALAEAAAADSGGFSFVARNKTSVLPQWNLKF